MSGFHSHMKSVMSLADNIFKTIVTTKGTRKDDGTLVYNHMFAKSYQCDMGWTSNHEYVHGIRIVLHKDNNLETFAVVNGAYELLDLFHAVDYAGIVDKVCEDFPTNLSINHPPVNEDGWSPVVFLHTVSDGWLCGHYTEEEQRPGKYVAYTSQGGMFAKDVTQWLPLEMLPAIPRIHSK